MNLNLVIWTITFYYVNMIHKHHKYALLVQVLLIYFIIKWYKYNQSVHPTYVVNVSSNIICYNYIVQNNVVRNKQLQWIRCSTYNNKNDRSHFAKRTEILIDIYHYIWNTMHFMCVCMFALSYLLLLSKHVKLSFH